MEEITIELYSEKGLAVKGATYEQVMEIAAKLGPKILANLKEPQGWVFSRRHEEKIRVIIEAMNGSGR